VWDQQANAEAYARSTSPHVLNRLSGFMLLLVRALDGSPSCCASG
jgi:hypothetical protein